MLELFVANEGPAINKWHHYLPLYERYFGQWRGKPVRFLEIGVAQGGSLAVWRKFFGPQAVLFGIDILEDCARLNGIDGQVRIGSQDDPAFLRSVVAEMGGVDVVLDDGSHMMAHIEASLDALFPLLEAGGTYMIEDLHTSYWRRWGGGLKGKPNFFNSVRAIIDDMHHWYHDGEIQRPALQDFVVGLHVHDSIVVIDKDVAHRPMNSSVGIRDSRQAAARRQAKSNRAGER
ncbi:hypothetical protein LHP98_04460 [Rhodobacter sp. Har01]|uniref:class I SAM-dependent methyltransferase n=1 Tax=Rhodobacter sp. Har01 TaxID=2883999 RepID=UPI001D07349C|nr:class I SAM-dependent methyltransferase [Rhodobacter sp. Har01]MCB6177381.1 hypothetical protein [Rhodobacter sp. Har01]